MYTFYLREKANVLEGAVSTSYYFLKSFYYFHRFSYNQVAVKTLMLYWCEMGISKESLVRKARRKTYTQKYIHKFFCL